MNNEGKNLNELSVAERYERIFEMRMTDVARSIESAKTSVKRYAEKIARESTDIAKRIDAGERVYACSFLNSYVVDLTAAQQQLATLEEQQSELRLMQTYARKGIN